MDPSPRPSQLLLAFCHFLRRWEIREGYVNFSIADNNLLNDAFRDFALGIVGKLGPAVIEGFGFSKDFICREIIDFEKIDLGLKFRMFGSQLVELFFGRFVELAEALASNLAVEV